jgi:hypothetical protein
MTFPAGRDPHTPSTKSGATGEATPGRRDNDEPNGGNPMDHAGRRIGDNTPIGELIARREAERRGLRETTDEELVDAPERMDGGMRLVVPMLFDGLGPDPMPGETEHLPIEDAPLEKVEVDDELIGRMADSVAEFRDEQFRKLRHLDKHAPRRIHVEAMALVAKCDDFLAVVSEYFRSQS